MFSVLKRPTIADNFGVALASLLVRVFVPQMPAQKAPGVTRYSPVPPTNGDREVTRRKRQMYAGQYRGTPVYCCEDIHVPSFWGC